MAILPMHRQPVGSGSCTPNSGTVNSRLDAKKGLQPMVYHVSATAGYVRRAHIRCCDLWYILKPDGEEQLDCFWSCLKRTNEALHDAAFARAGLPTPEIQKLQQQQQAQNFIAERAAYNNSAPTSQQANWLIQQAENIGTSTPAMCPNTAASCLLKTVQQTSQSVSASQPDLSSALQRDAQAIIGTNTSVLANEWTRDKLRRPQTMAEAVTEMLNTAAGKEAEPQIRKALGKKYHNIVVKPETRNAWFSKSYVTEHGVEFMIMGDPDCLAANGQHAFEIKARMRPQTVKRTRDSIHPREQLQMLGYAMLSGASQVSLVQGLERDGKYMDLDVMAFLDFSNKCRNRYLKIASIQDKKRWTSDNVPSVKAFVTVLTAFMSSRELQDELLSMNRAKQALWLRCKIAQAKSKES